MSTRFFSVRGRDTQHLVWAFRLTALGAMLVASNVAAVGPNERRLTNARVGIAIEAPPGWALSQHTGYADTIVLLLHPDGSRISVSVSSTVARTASDLYEQNRPGLLSQGWSPAPLGAGAHGSFGVDLSSRTRPDKIRQHYLVRDVPRGRQAVVLTLVCRTPLFSVRTSALDFVAARLTLLEPTPSPESARAGSNVGSGGRAGGR